MTVADRVWWFLLGVILAMGLITYGARLQERRTIIECDALVNTVCDHFEKVHPDVKDECPRPKR